MTKRTGRIVLGLGGVLAALGALSAVTGVRVSEAQGGGLRGVWTAQPSRWKTTDGGTATIVQLLLRRTRPGHDWNSSFPVALTDLKGLSVEQTRGARTDVHFDLVRDAGTMAFEGRFDDGDGAGHFTFAPNAEYLQEMRKQGYEGIDEEKAFALATHDVSRDFIRQLADLGYTRLALDELINLRIHGASAEFVKDLRSLGYERLSTDELVNMRIHGVSSEFIRSLRDLGYERIRVDDLVNMRIHGVTPDFIRRVNGGTVAAASVDQLVNMKIHGRDQ